MATQLLLPGIEPLSARRHRLFLALLPDPAAAARIVDRAHCLRDELALTGKPFPTTRLHVSLLHLGDHADLPHAVVRAAELALASVVAPPFDIVFDQLASFSGRHARPFVLFGGEGVAAVTEFQHSIARAFNASRWQRRCSYTPHMTLLYDRRRIATRAVEPIAWTAREVVLVHRVISSGNVSAERGYESASLARWTLDDRPGQRPGARERLLRFPG